MATVQTLDISTNAGTIAGVVHLPDRVPAPVIICCHGLLSSKDSSKFVAVAENFSRAGLAVVRFDFSGCGETSMEREASLIGSRLRDLSAVIDHVSGQPWATEEVGLLGSSLGGYIALLTMAAAKHRIKAAAVWAAPFSLTRVQEALQHSTLESYPMGFPLGEPPDLDGLPPVPNVLVVHGQQDELVPWKSAESIYRRLGEPKRLILLEKGDHRLLDPTCRAMAMRASLAWFEGAVSGEQ